MNSPLRWDVSYSVGGSDLGCTLLMTSKLVIEMGRLKISRGVGTVVGVVRILCVVSSLSVTTTVGFSVRRGALVGIGESGETAK